MRWTSLLAWGGAAFGLAGCFLEYDDDDSAAFAYGPRSGIAYATDDETWAMTFSGEMTLTEDQPQSRQVSGSYSVRYWRDWQDAGTLELACLQTLIWTGTAAVGVGSVSDCVTCTGLVTIDPSTVVDLVPSGEECDPGGDEAAGQNWGAFLTSPLSSGGGEGWLSMYLLDVPTAQALGLEPTPDHTIEQTTWLADADYTLHAIGYAPLLPGNAWDELGVGDTLGLSDGVAAVGFWAIYADASDPRPVSPEPVGRFFFWSFWYLY